MRSARAVSRSIGTKRARALPTFSRLTIRPAAPAPVGHSVRLGEALRASREALGDIQRQLDALLAAVRTPGGRPAPDAVDRLHVAARRAGAAVACLADA